MYIFYDSYFKDSNLLYLEFFKRIIIYNYQKEAMELITKMANNPSVLEFELQSITLFLQIYLSTTKIAFCEHSKSSIKQRKVDSEANLA